MNTDRILNEIYGLTLNDKLYLLQKMVKYIIEDISKQEMILAAGIMKNEYCPGSGLVAFETLDHEDFYEKR
jgi:hypothetical protein